MGYYCNNDYEHRQDARRDYERSGSYGYDREYYDHYTSDECKRAYTDEFDNAVREERYREERREEERQMEQAQMRQDEARSYRNQQEEEFYYQQMQYEEQQAQYPDEPKQVENDDLPF